MAKNPTALRLAIVRSGRTQRDIANALGMWESRLSLIVNGEHCDEATREKIAAELACPVADIFPDGDEREAA